MSRTALLIGYMIGIALGLGVLTLGGCSKEPAHDPGSSQREPGSTVTGGENAYRPQGNALLPLNPRQPEVVIDGKDIPREIEFRKDPPAHANTMKGLKVPPPLKRQKIRKVSPGPPKAARKREEKPVEPLEGERAPGSLLPYVR